MKLRYFVFVLVFFSLEVKAQDPWGKVTDSIAMISRSKADDVLKHFDTIISPKILFSVEDTYFYLIIKGSPDYKEYYVRLDSTGEIGEFSYLSPLTRKKREKHQIGYRKLLLEAEPIFQLDKYHDTLITHIPEAKMVKGRPSYFVLQDTGGNRYGEYSLSLVTMPVPIDRSLWVYLVRRISEKMDN